MINLGMIDVQSCAQIVSRAVTENVVPSAILAGVFAIIFLVYAVLYSFENRERRLISDFLRREKLLNKYEDWKKDREVK